MQRLALVGPMGVGKTTVGQKLSARLGIPFVDLDLAIEIAEGKTILQLFERFGEAAFRQMELHQLEVVAQRYSDGCICATGGGIVVTDSCRRMLGEQWSVIWLSAEVDTLVSRLATESAGRPMLNTSEPLEKRVRDLMTARLALYQEVSNYCLTVDGRSVDDIVEEIMNWLINHGEFDPTNSSMGVLQDGATY